MRRSTVTTAGRRTFFQLDAGIDFATDDLALPPSVHLMLQANVACGQPRIAGQSLSDIVAFIVGGELAHQHQVGLVALDNLGKRFGDDAGIQFFVFGFDANRLVGAHRKALIEAASPHPPARATPRSLALTDRLVCAIFGQTERCLNGVLIKLV